MDCNCFMCDRNKTFTGETCRRAVMLFKNQMWDELNKLISFRLIHPEYFTGVDFSLGMRNGIEFIVLRNSEL